MTKINKGNKESMKRKERKEGRKQMEEKNKGTELNGRGNE
jgi:hypothetical protein